MPIGTVGRRGQTTLPKEIRTHLHIQEGDSLLYILRGEEVLIRPLRKTLLDYAGSVPVSGPQDWEQVRNSVIQSVAQRHAEDRT